MLATEYAEHYGIEAQREGESDVVFRGRVSTALRIWDISLKRTKHTKMNAMKVAIL